MLLKTNNNSSNVEIHIQGGNYNLLTLICCVCTPDQWCSRAITCFIIQLLSGRWENPFQREKSRASGAGGHLKFQSSAAAERGNFFRCRSQENGNENRRAKESGEYAASAAAKTGLKAGSCKKGKKTLPPDWKGAALFAEYKGTTQGFLFLVEVAYH
jgi:hypothetical protein